MDSMPMKYRSISTLARGSAAFASRQLGTSGSTKEDSDDFGEQAGGGS
jgi:hypothetical protein